MKRVRSIVLSSAIALLTGSILCAGTAYATMYTSDPNLSDFASNSTDFATLSNFFAGDTGSPYTTTYTTLSEGLRVYAGGSEAGLPSGNNWIIANFGSAVSAIRVFPNIDHFGAAYDGYQYQIWGYNGSTWTELFDAQSVNGSGEPFTLGSYFGTAPTLVNNVLTPGAGPAGTVGYIADFNF